MYLAKLSYLILSSLQNKKEEEEEAEEKKGETNTISILFIQCVVGVIYWR